ncbi:hypothetical protein DFQ27_008345 [Actinomortierella ambigua]|uniref:Uncharacterized protein n=1 Tax=Actinomortierella ambigua TaxID=1343610 RepID=A0A9P6QLP5_9FUNG|nr:hypothetical protein DFQ27_008345 [Actinomortierella ambigua]
MEATTFICLTDVIHPVRHVVKDGISIARSLKEHEEITVIGMDAAIPDVISLVLRAGRMGIGYQGEQLQPSVDNMIAPAPEGYVV